jgi:hypothetical protein
MTLSGTIKNGVVVLASGAKALPEGTRVSVRPLKNKPARPAKPERRRKLLRHAGKGDGMPPDAARNLEQYLYGD